MQRVHENDLTGFLQDKKRKGGTHYLSLVLPAIAEKKEGKTLWYGGIYRRGEGEVLSPARESIETLRKTKNDLGSYIFAGQYQQQPATAGEAIVKKEWFKIYQNINPSDFDLVIQSWDTAMTENNNSDYSVGITIGMVVDEDTEKMTFYILDMIREKMEFPQGS